MNTLRSKQLREQRAALIAEQRKDLNLEGDKFTSEVRTRMEARDKDIDQLEKDIEIAEKTEKRERDIVVATGSEKTGSASDAETRKAQIAEEGARYTAAFEKYLRGQDMSTEERSILGKGYRTETGEFRAQSASTTTAGGFTVPAGFMAELERAQKAFGGVRNAARVLTTGGGNPLPWPTIDDTSNTGADIAENTAASDQDMTFGSVTLNAYKMNTGLVLVPNELFEDTGLDLNAELASIMGERIGRRQNNKYTLGSGSSTFTGVVPASTTNANIVIAASATVIAADELFDIQHAVDPAYRNNPKSAWMMNDSIKKVLRKLKDTTGRYLLEPALTAGAPDTLLGNPIVINQDMASTVATGNITMLFGDWSKFIIRDVRGLVIRRLNERYADADQVGFVGFYRGDSKLVTASSKALVQYHQL